MFTVNAINDTHHISFFTSLLKELNKSLDLRVIEQPEVPQTSDCDAVIAILTVESVKNRKLVDCWVESIKWGNVGNF